VSRRVFTFFALALGLGITGAAAAHHPPLMERCVISSFTGQVEQIEWRMPHVELFIRTDDGVRHRLIWRNIHQLAWIDIDRDTLRIGDQVVITATTPRDAAVERPMLLSNIRRTSDGWEWSQEPQGC
jgi:hypothetical protein